MNLSRRHGGLVILLSFVAAMLLTIIPLPDGLRAYRPDWTGLVLIYWCLALPDRVGLFYGWLAGLFLDVLTASLLGMHALALCLVAFFCLRIHRQIRVYPLWQQALVVLVLLTVHQLILLWINSIIGRPGPGISYWIPVFIGAALWPPVFSVLRALRRGFAVR